jgi:hypothetical protein
VRAHLADGDDGLVTVAPVLEREPDFERLLTNEGEVGFDWPRLAEGTGRPVGAADFVADLDGAGEGRSRGGRGAESRRMSRWSNWTYCNMYRVARFSIRSQLGAAAADTVPRPVQG